MRFKGLVLTGLAVVLGCGGGGGEPPKTAAASSTAARQGTAADRLPPNALRRSDVVQTVRAGLGTFLQRVDVDDHPVFVGGRFHGFRIAALRGDPSFWAGVDLKPGDVVTQVNGFGIEHPEDALQAFTSLEKSPELVVDYERDGEPHKLRYKIIDDAASPPPAPPSAPTAKPVR